MNAQSRILIAIILLLEIAASNSCRAQPETAVQNPGGISMTPVVLLNQSGTGPKVMGGRPAATSLYKASFFSSAQRSRCTATLVGPSALLLAAHCVGNGQEASIEVDDTPYKGRCTHADGYKGGNGDASADYALCKMMDKNNQPVSGIAFENVNVDPKLMWKGLLIQLTGYGCTVPGGKSDGVFRVAEAQIANLPGENEPNTILIHDHAALCPGDSGGGAYIVYTAKKRLVVSVNSRIDYANGDSYLSSLSSKDGLAFLKKWSEKNENVIVCGYNQHGSPCR
jgi:hypothetical protein